MLIPVKVTWTFIPAGDMFGGGTAHGAGKAFNTDTKLIEPYTTSVRLTWLDPVPANYQRPAGFYLHFECAADFTLTQWYYDGVDGTDVYTYPNSTTCGYVPPATDPVLVCALGAASLTQGGQPGAYTLTAAVAGTAHGALRYALDGGAEQPSPVFLNVALGPRTVVVRDTGLAGCTRTVSLLVAGAAAPAGPVAGIDFVGQPLFYQADAAVGAELVLELYAETQHRAEDYALVFRARQRADALGRVRWRLDALLAPLLAAVVPPTTAITAVCRTPLVDYFVRTAPVLPTGQPGAYTTGPLRTALRGGLPAEHRGLDYFAYRLEAFGQPPFLSWKPAGQALTPAQPEWLFWLCPADSPAQLTVRRSYERTGFASGAPLVEDEAVDLSGGRGPFGRLLAIPVRPRAGMVAVSVALYDADDTALSGVVRYPIVAATPRTRYLHFTNSLGGFDTLRTEGRLEGVLEAAADRDELPVSPLGGLAERAAFAVTATRKLKLATGWLTAAQLRWLQELVLAREIWEAQPNRLLPVDPAKRQLAYVADENPLRGLLLEFDYAFAPTAYADLP